MFKVFSRPQIDLEDILKFDKVQAYVAENNLDQKFRTAEIQVKYSVILKRKEQCG
jgi:tRNA uridine 5-carboxymethylaminomethyl modification enzyme